MQHLTSLVFILFLTVLASFGSFWWSRYAHSTHQSPLGWTALAIGTVFLLTAVAIVVMTSSRLSLVPWLAQGDQKAIVGSPSAEEAGSRANPFQRLDARAPSQQVTPKISSSDPSSKVRERQLAVSVQRTSTARSDAGAPMSDHAKRRSGVPAFNAADPWAATRCVIPIRRDPADLTRWTVENDCPFAVGIVIATCSDSGSCEQNATQRWAYEAHGIVLPEKAQRSVTVREQTFFGQHVERLACALSSERAIQLIGESSEVRASEEWQREFDEARAVDDCLAWVARLSEQGRRTGIPIHLLMSGDRLSHLTN